VAAVVAVGVWLAADREGDPASGPGPAVAPSPVAARIQVAGKPRQLVLDADTLWVVAERRLDRIDASTRRVVASVPGRADRRAPAAQAIPPRSAPTPRTTR
jgi:hypothetical protein